MNKAPRILDFQGCEFHGMEDMTDPSMHKDGHLRKSTCRVCKRNREAKRHYNGPKCINGHLKTPQTWVFVGSRTYRTCRPCNLKASRGRYARTKENKLAVRIPGKGDQGGSRSAPSGAMEGSLPKASAVR